MATIAGFAFTWWARLTIGTLWSSGVTRKADHRVVDTGPYGLVRHPIYTGLIAAAFATAFVPLTPLTLAGAALITFGFFLKGRLEEGSSEPSLVRRPTTATPLACRCSCRG